MIFALFPHQLNLLVGFPVVQSILSNFLISRVQKFDDAGRHVLRTLQRLTCPPPAGGEKVAGCTGWRE